MREENARGVTVFFSSHVLGEVQRLCRRVAIIKEGTILTSEDVAALRQKRSARSPSPPRGPPRRRTSPRNGAGAICEGDAVRFLYAGDSNTLVQELSRFDIHQLRIEEPSLEEVFMHYYSSSKGGAT